jgi:hypothetical protein
MDNDTILGIVVGSLCAFGILSAMAVLVLGTVFKTRFGLNPFNVFAVKCAECGAGPPIVRVPRTTYETLWGGWTCDECGTENDKWGNRL